MENSSKEAAKSFVDTYFPVKQPNSSSSKSDILDGIFPPMNQQDPWKKQASVRQTSNVHNSTTADSKAQGSNTKGQGTSQNGSNASVFLDASDPFPMSSSVDYGCRDYYPPSQQHPGGYDRLQDRKDGYDYPDPESSRGEWWQDSFYY